MAYSTTWRLSTGRTPGMPRQTGQVWVLGGAAEGRGAAAEDLGPGFELGVHLQPDDGFEFHVHSSWWRQPKAFTARCARGAEDAEEIGGAALESPTIPEQNLPIRQGLSPLGGPAAAASVLRQPDRQPRQAAEKGQQLGELGLESRIIGGIQVARGAAAAQRHDVTAPGPALLPEDPLERHVEGAAGVFGAGVVEEPAPRGEGPRVVQRRPQRPGERGIRHHPAGGRV